ncbi:MULTISPECIES: helix-turn-helix domain-containing protein [unclassified Amycolatopsis]|uniref:TetR/AcrR family transcriptional regulator n=1 Tax=unclassified Amycolatopsis TaxID=2618356 RepID=UPI0028758876|nr:MULTISPECIES: helix-turn-helix domain-containing protein [unclassified Amycolatopsis]MDS0139249.1 helix-turn-helix transcriptional regulator [Amycolatopsis sp. 505]MDS0144481.1 helix-turn-helix transcriptional regulator [Amycolatopsis sp. CM201R]
MRADAARNLELLLTTGARMLAEDPATSIAAIAAEAGVDRRTVYRRFTSREELLSAVYQARLDAIEAAIEAARFWEAPVPEAMDRYVLGVVKVNRTWPTEVSRMRSDPEIWARRMRAVEEVDRFLKRAADEGYLQPGLPDRWPGSVLGALVGLSTKDKLPLNDAQAAIVIVGTFLRAFGTGRSWRS